MNRLVFLFALAFVQYSEAGGQYDKCDMDYEKGGCFVDDPNDRALPNKILVENDRSSTVLSGFKFTWKNFTGSLAGLACRCAAKAREAGYKYFGLQSFGVCWAGNSGYDKFGEANPKKCVQDVRVPCNDHDDIPCVGKSGFNYAYRLLTSVDGGFGPWSEWSRCSEICTQERTRKCNNPEPEGHGLGCHDYKQGHFMEIKNCYEDDCMEEGEEGEEEYWDKRKMKKIRKRGRFTLRKSN